MTLAIWWQREQQMGKPKLSPESDTTRLEIRIPISLKEHSQASLRGGETLSSVIRSLLEELVRKRQGSAMR